jgi:AAA15 family ATPase/GTPase
MIQSIEIENFRCFEKTEVNGFRRINLITGKNNSGKTALLEAFYYCLDLNYSWIFTESRLSGPDQDHAKNVFFNQNLKNVLTISCKDLESEYLFNSSYINPVYQSKFNLKFIFDKNLQLPHQQNLVTVFDDLFIAGKIKIIEECIQKIEPNIEEIRTFSSKPGVLFLRKKGEENYLPIYYFGDAIQKIARYIINILSFDSAVENRILLIDEIENGLHYSAQDDFWRMLFKLGIEYDVQIFASTHSLEMIKAYQRVASEFEGEAAFFEMARNANSNQIIGINHEMDVLEYELIANETIRGE